MNRFIVLFFLLITLGCSTNDRVDRCSFLVSNALVSADINLNLPQFDQLRFTGNSVYVANQGIAGIYVSNVGNNNFRAFDAADPAHAPTPCSFLDNVQGIGICGCSDANQYTLLTGQAVNSDVICLLREYRVDQGANNTLLITN